MRALVVQHDRTVQVEQRPIPTLKDDEVLVKIVSIGQNPTDEKHAELISSPGDILGCDGAGTLDKKGSKVPEAIQLGSRVLFFTRGGVSKDHGAFAEYCAIHWQSCSLIPHNITFEHAATIPIPFFTAVQSLFLRLGLTEPTPEKSPPLKNNGQWVLVWSGASSVGQFAIQLLHLAGYNVATTASQANWPLLKSYGADAIFDYKDGKVVDKIREITGDSLEYAFDCVVSQDSPSKIANSMSSQGGSVVCVLPCDQSKLPRKDVKIIETLLYTAIDGKDAYFGPVVFKAGPKDREHHVEWLQHATTLFGQGHIKTLPIENMGGLDDVQKGFQKMRDGKVKAQKLVYFV